MKPGAYGSMVFLLSLFLVGCGKSDSTLSIMHPIPPGPLPAELDRPLSPGVLPTRSVDGRDLVEAGTFQERLILLKTLLPKPLALPPGVPEFVTEIDRQSDPKYDNWHLFLSERAYLGQLSPATYRELLVDTCSRMGMSVRYDAQLGSFTADFAWHWQDPRSPQELLAALQATKPELGKLTGSQDAWLRMLDALISKPDNYAKAWRLRFLNDTRAESLGTMPAPSAVLWSGLMLDTNGNSIFVVIKIHCCLTTKSPPSSFIGYAFDSQGRFTSGVIFSDSYEDFREPHIALASGSKFLVLYHGPQAVAVIGLDTHGFEPQQLQNQQSDCLGKVLFRTD